VLTTVFYVRRPAPPELVYRQELAGRVVNEWRFAVVRLWEQPPERFTKKKVAQERTEEARHTCARLTKALHATVAPRLVPVIEACSELARLRRWTERAPRLSDAEFASLVTGHGGARPTRRRAPRPARKATRTSRP